MKILIRTYGYFGDILFASSIAKKLKEENKADQVDYLIGFPQLEENLTLNPYIDNVYVSERPGPMPIGNGVGPYDNEIQLGQISLLVPPPAEFQMLCGIENPSTEFEIYTNPGYDELVKQEFDKIREQLTDDAKIIYVPYNWDAKAYVFTEEEYENERYHRPRDAEIPYRDCKKIVESLSIYHYVVLGGLPHGVNQMSGDSLQKSFSLETSVIKHCDWYVGPEGGLANVAGGVGTKSIITTDFIHHLYGPKGIIKPTPNPQLGPSKMFPNGEHYELSPYLSDEEVFQGIFNIINTHNLTSELDKNESTS